MAQGALPFKYEEEKKDFGLTGFAGLFLFLDLLYKSNFPEMVNRHVSAKANKDGWSDFHVLLSLILLNLAGGDSVDDIRKLESDSGLVRFFKHLELRNTFGRKRKKLKSQWANGLKNAFPSSSSIFRYLSLFHNVQSEQEREKRKAYIPTSNQHLKGLSEINRELLELLQLNRPQSTATIDMDATVVESNKKSALFSYKKFKGYQPLNSWWWEQDWVIYSEFRDGNVPAGFDQKRVFEETLSCLPQGVETVYLRSDSAGYQHDLMKYCEMGENKRFGRIGFTISCDMSQELKAEIRKVEDSDWQPIHKIIKGKVQRTGQEWAEVPFVPELSARSKKAPDYRYIVVREKLQDRVLPGFEDNYENLPFPNVPLSGQRYKVSGIVTNLQWYGESIIHWSRERCGNSEHAHHEMKEGFAGGTLPSNKFGVNAAWWWIMVISMNLVTLQKIVSLDESWRRKRIKSIRYWLINIPGRIIYKSKELIVRLNKGNEMLDCLISARCRIMLLGAHSPG